MKKFILTVIVGYLAVIALIVVTATLKGTKKNHQQKYFEKNDTKKNLESKTIEAVKGGFAQKTSSGNLKVTDESEKIKKDKVRQEFKTYYQKGRLSSRSFYQDGKLQGVSEFYDENGKVWAKIPYMDNQLTGSFEIQNRNKDGGLIWSFNGGVCQGSFSFYYEEGKNLLSGEMTQGYFTGLPRFFSENGDENKAFYQLNSNNIAPSSEFKLYNERGDVKAIGSQGSQGEQQTELRTYYENGKLSAHWFLVNGLMTGQQTVYYPEGPLRMELPFLEGALHGEIREYDLQGQLRWSAGFEKGQKQGEELFYYPDGSLWSQSKWQEGVLTELPKVYSQGKVQKTAV